MGADNITPAPTSSLPPLRPIESLTASRISSALDLLYAIYCPLAAPARTHQLEQDVGEERRLAPPPVDSGYTSGLEEDDDAASAAADRLAGVRADVYERDFTTRWLTTFIARASEIPGLDADDEARERALERASFVLASFTATSDEDDGCWGDADGDDKDAGIVRRFTFGLAPSSSSSSSSSSEPATEEDEIHVELVDGAQSKTDHTDVGLQSWGAAIVFCKLMCADPARFGLGGPLMRGLGPETRIVELGAGTGLVSLVLGKLVPRLDIGTPTIVATDYHPVVLENLKSNVDANFGGGGGRAHQSAVSVETCCLDWSAPVWTGPLDARSNLLLATDVVYATEHAEWLRDVVGQLLGPEGVFWMFNAVRRVGKFSAINETVKAAFSPEKCPKLDDGRVLTILGQESIERPADVWQRGDEKGYQLFKIGWA